MRILTNFQDYYDKGLMYGIDELIVYKRLSNISKFEEKEKVITKWLNIDNLYVHRIRTFVIYFCGDIYPGVRIEEHGFDFNSKKGKISFYNAASALSHMENMHQNYKITNTLNKFEKQIFNRNYAYVQDFFNLEYKDIFLNWRKLKDHITVDLHKLNKEFNLLALENNIPYFIIYPEEKNYYIEHNPQLSMWDFNKVKNPQEAFQEISMYVGSVLQQPSNPMIEISNEEMAKKKGFGHKYAFRKEPSKK